MPSAEVNSVLKEMGNLTSTMGVLAEEIRNKVATIDQLHDAIVSIKSDMDRLSCIVITGNGKDSIVTQIKLMKSTLDRLDAVSIARSDGCDALKAHIKAQEKEHDNNTTERIELKTAAVGAIVGAIVTALLGYILMH